MRAISLGGVEPPQLHPQPSDTQSPIRLGKWEYHVWFSESYEQTVERFFGRDHKSCIINGERVIYSLLTKTPDYGCEYTDVEYLGVTCHQSIQVTYAFNQPVSFP